ncbi:hypothetical protein P3H78_07040 [Streptomyces sp. K1PA1]|uniref:Uncharacterized protein n=1 Tax=Streptomyces tropicalis TaxID=3034234 RepID=A0ABT6A167_9ACTN|nr:hypothetical protein [Streptomyces tropicalis]
MELLQIGHIRPEPEPSPAAREEGDGLVHVSGSEPAVISAGRYETLSEAVGVRMAENLGLATGLRR